MPNEIPREPDGMLYNPNVVHLEPQNYEKKERQREDWLHEVEPFQHSMIDPTHEILLPSSKVFPRYQLRLTELEVEAVIAALELLADATKFDIGLPTKSRRYKCWERFSRAQLSIPPEIRNFDDINELAQLCVGFLNTQKGMVEDA